MAPPQGWYISYIDRDPAVIARQEALEKMKRKELDDQERHNKLMDKLVEEAREKGLPPPEYTGASTQLQQRCGAVTATASTAPLFDVFVPIVRVFNCRDVRPHNCSNAVALSRRRRARHHCSTCSCP